MRFLWKSQLRKEGGKLLPKSSSFRNKTSRKEKLASHQGDHPSYLGILFLWFLFLGTLVYVAFFSPYLFITKASFSGAPDSEAESIELFVKDKLDGKYFWIFPKNDFFFISPHKLEAKIKSEFPLVQTVSVRRIFPHGLDIKIEPREKLVIWCTGSSCYHILEDGSVSPRTEIFDKEVNSRETLTVKDQSEKPVLLGANVFPQTFVPFIISLPKAMTDRLSVEIENNFSVPSRFANEIRAKTKEGWEIYISTERPLETSLDALGLVLEKEITDRRASLRYVDLRTENRIYYVFREGTALSGEMDLDANGEKVTNKSEKKGTEKNKKK